MPTIRKLDLPPVKEVSLEARIERLERDQKDLLLRFNGALGILGALSLRFEGALGALTAGGLLDRRTHSIYAEHYAEHEKKLVEIRALKTIKERLQRAQDHNVEKYPGHFTIYLEDLGLFAFLRDAKGKPTLTQDEAMTILQAGVPFTVYSERFFRDVYGLEVIAEEKSAPSSAGREGCRD